MAPFKTKMISSVSETKKFPARRGRVFLRQRGNFYGQGETFNPDPAQLPQFLPRTDSQLPIYEGSIWQDHVAILHGVLRSTLKTRSWLDDDDMIELLNCVSYGMNQSTLYLHPWMILGPPRTNGGAVPNMPFQRSWIDQFGMEMIDGSYQYGIPLDDDPFKNKMRLDMLGRRWLVAPISQFEAHWIVTIFDRQRGQLYIFDTAGFSRDKRIEAAVQLWARFWNALDMPFHFEYFVPEVTEQASGWECGMLCVHWVAMTLRNRVGVRMLASDVSIPVDDFAMFHRSFPNDLPLTDSSLYIPDWMPINCGTVGSGLDAVLRHTQVLICNELGLKNEEVFKKADGVKERSPFQRIFDVFNGKNNKEAVKEFFTGHGGLQFSHSLKSKPRPYDRQAQREHYPVRGTEGFIELRPRKLASVPPQDLKSIIFPDTVVTEDHGLWVKNIQPDDEEADVDRYPVLLELGDRSDPNKILPPLTITLDNSNHRAGRNNIIFFEFSLRSSFPSQSEAGRPSTLVTLPVTNELQPAINQTPTSPTSSESDQESSSGETEVESDPDIAMADAPANDETGDSANQGGDNSGEGPRGIKRERDTDDTDDGDDDDDGDKQGPSDTDPSPRPHKRARVEVKGESSS